MSVRRHRRHWDFYDRLAAALALAGTALVLLLPFGLT